MTNTVSPASSGYIDVGAGHSIYFEDHNPDSQPVVLFLHGGPGGGVRDEERALFQEFSGRVVLPDQRAAGRSHSVDPERDNTTSHLIADLEKLRAHLGIERWIPWGGSWGSTLALAYAQRHPDRVTGLVLYGVFLCRKTEMQWFYGDGAATIYPDEYERFVSPLASSVPRDDGMAVINAFHDAMRTGSEAKDLRVAQCLARWEAVNSYLRPTEDLIEAFTDPAVALTLARLETRYFVNGGFLGRDDALVDGMDRIAHLPCRIIQGRYDTICPPRAAWDVHCALPESRLEFVEAAHDIAEPAINTALRQALRGREFVTPGPGRTFAY